MSYSHVALLVILYSISTVSTQNCKSPLENRANLVPAHLFSTAKQPKYRISSVIPGADHTLNDSTLMLATADTKCPKDCLYDLQSHKSKEGSILHVRGSPFPEFVPIGYTALSSEKKLSCARLKGFCGAQVPVYRFYRLVPNAIIHAYSFKESDSNLSGYVREVIPICYAWSTTTATATATTKKVTNPTTPKPKATTPKPITPKPTTPKPPTIKATTPKPATPKPTTKIATKPAVNSSVVG